MSGHNQTGEQQLKALRCRAVHHATILCLCSGKMHMEAPPMFRRPFFWGCFNHTTCKFCGSRLRPETYTKKRKSPDGLILESTTTTLRCSNRSCHKTLSPFAGTIWADIGNRQLFVYVVDSFISRGTVVGVANMTGAKEETITRYFRIIKMHSTKRSRRPLTRSKLAALG